MGNKQLLNRFFLSNPLFRGLIELFLLISSGIAGWLFSWLKLPLFPILNIAGGVLILGGFLFHGYCERDHKQAHRKSENIEKIVKNGIYSKIRHPLYLSVIIMNIGIALAFGVVLTLVFSLILIAHWILTAIAEEESLLQKFPEEYAQYLKNVRWRLIPGIF